MQMKAFQIDARPLDGGFFLFLFFQQELGSSFNFGLFVCKYGGVGGGEKNILDTPET